jgi:FKBP-type peptidyl-prolyl cis-trans isomerase 2
VGRVKLTGEVFDLTEEALARKEGIHNPKQSYGPVLVILGSGMAVPGVEKNLLQMKPGEEREFDVGQEEGFGRRNPGLIKIISYQRFISQKINPVPGIFVNIDGRHARIQSVSGGRVRVDFNSPLAGKDLRYRVRLVRRLTSPQEKAQAMIDHYGLKATATLKQGNLDIRTEAKLHDTVKGLLDRQLTKWIREIKKITYTAPAAKKPGKEKPAGERQNKQV